MSQVTNYTIPGSPLNMMQLAASLNAMFAASVSANRGASAPANPFEGMLWWDTSADPVETLKRYTVVAGWVNLADVDISTGTVSFYRAGVALGTMAVEAATDYIKNTLMTTQGDIIYASAANTPARLGKGTTGYFLKQGAAAPEWAAVPSPPSDGSAATPSLRTLGTGAAQACAGNDARLSNTRTPTDGSVTSAKVSSTIKDAAATTASMRTLGVGANQACAGNDARLNDDRTPAAASVSQSKLKTSQGTVTVSGGNVVILPGGEYGFMPTIQCTGFPQTLRFVGSSSSYVLALKADIDGENSGSFSIKQRYVTSSGEVNWLFVLRDKKTKKILASWQAPDHPCMGNGGDPVLVPHPFPKYDSKIQEIICVNLSTNELAEIENTAKSKNCQNLLETIHKYYVIDDRSIRSWPTVAVTVGLPENHDWQHPERIKPIKKQIFQPVDVLCRGLRKL